MTPEEITALVERSKPVKRSSMRLSTLPTSFADAVRDLRGRYDLVFPVHHFDDHTAGDGNDWVNADVPGRHDHNRVRFPPAPHPQLHRLRGADAQFMACAPRSGKRLQKMGLSESKRRTASASANGSFIAAVSR